MSKYKIASVSYLNSKPFLYGLKNYPFKNEIEFSVETPSNIAKHLLNNEVDLALVPVAILNEMEDYYLLNGFCIGANGPVQSVCLFAEMPIEKCKTVLLDYQSRTSVMLTKILMKEYWKLIPEFVSASEGYEKNIKGETAGLIIGDRALEIKSKFPFVYDLSQEWKKMTNLPFVFAAWVSTKEIPDETKIDLTNAFQFGINSIDKVSAEEQKKYPGIDVKDYLTKRIDFILNDDKIKAMKLFLYYINEMEKVIG